MPPEPDAPTAVSRPDFPDATAEARAERFLARVAALTPEEWGRLDAIAQRQYAGDLLTRLERVQRTARMSDAAWRQVPRSREAVVVMRSTQLLLVTTSIVRELRDWVLRHEREPWRWPPRMRDGATASPQTQRILAALETWTDRLMTVAAAQPGGLGLATSLLCMALSVLLSGGPELMPLAAEIYEPVEPVIPFASLDAG